MNDKNDLFKERRKILESLGKALTTVWLGSFLSLNKANAIDNKQKIRTIMKLPNAKTRGTLSLEQVVFERRTTRSYASKTLSLEQLAQLLWAAQGITGKKGNFRAAPSAGALYPMDVYVVIGKNGVVKIEAGVYHYEAQRHLLSQVIKKDLRNDVAKAALSQMWIARAPVSFIITAEYNRMGVKYGSRGERYAMIEAGHICQNLFLQAEALKLKAGIVGAFHDKKLNKILDLPRAHEPLLIMPAGYGASLG